MKWIFLLIYILPPALYAQSLHIRELRSRPSPKYYNTKDTTIFYPIIATANPTISRLINRNIAAAVLEFDPDDSSKTTREQLHNMTRMGLTDLSYEVNYNKNGILSLEIDLEVEAAYPNQSEVYLNFDIRTGQALGIRDLINDSLFNQFQSKVFADKVDSLKNYRDNYLKPLFANKEIDTSTYQWAIEEVDSNCINSIDMSHISLSKTGIKIVDPCEFPHAIRGISPDYELKYSYRFMYPYLKSEFQDRLLSQGSH